MKRFLTIFLTLTCLTALCCPAFAAVECTVPQNLPGVLTEHLAVHDVLILGGGEGETLPHQEPVADVPADGIYEEQPVDGKYRTMGALYQAWGGYEGYPDYVCGVWSTDGGLNNMTVAVTKDEAGEKGKGEILSLLENADSVTFIYQSYSYQELSAVNDAVVEQMLAGGSPINSCGIHEMENKVYITVLETAEGSQAVAQELVETYGDKVFVELGDMIFTDTTMEETRDWGVNGMLLVLAAAVLLAGVAVAVKLPARLTSAGNVVVERKLTHRQTEKIIAESTLTPPDRVEEQIKKKL